MAGKPNIIFIITDQQRFDTISALGAPWMRTPHLDELVRNGTAFTNCFTTSPVCVAARASLFTGMYAHSTGAFTNFQPWQPTWVRSFAEAGYHCVSIGKMHINPYDAPGGFHQKFVVENKDRPLFLDEHDRAFYDEWDKALHSRGLVKPSRYTRRARNPDEYRNALGCFLWDLDESMHPDFFVGDNVLWWLNDRKSEAPLFLEIGFPGPHPPYDPVKRYLDIYEHVDIPVPQSPPDISAQPAAQAVLRKNMVDFNFDSIAWRSDVTSADLLRLRRHYAANMTMIDEKLGAIIEVLRQRRYLENAIIVFTSDHGDALGDHGHIQKWTMYDTVTRVPLIIAGTNVPRGVKRNQLVQLMDVAPTLLEYAGIAVPNGWEAQSLQQTIESDTPARETVYAELGRDHIQTGAEYIVMRRDSQWKLVWYMGANDGELYDLQEDPGEQRNLWCSQEHLAFRDCLISETKDWAIRGMMKSKSLPARKPQQPMHISRP